MEVIIRQLLDFSHRQRLQYRKLRPAQIVTSAMLAVRDEASNRAVTLLQDAQPEDLCFAADPIRLEQALVNLLRNAIQSDTGITVHISWRLQNEHICFSVADSGPGISEKIRPRLFEPFFSTKDVGSGTGLGLAVVHGIVEEHRGHIRVGNSAAGGALFEIYLPMNNPHAGSHDRD